MSSNLAVKQDSSLHSIHSLRSPHALELTVLFREFIRYWTGFNTSIPESYSSQGPKDPVEYFTRWNGSANGTLVLRTSQHFTEKLAQNSQEKGANVGGHARLQEMATLYSIFLVRYAWMDDLFELGPILARPSQSALWPSGEPHAFCAIDVEGEPVEIRLWLGHSKEAGK